MTPEITSAIVLLKAKLKMVGELSEDPAFLELPQGLDKFESPTMELLREIDQHAETGLRLPLPKETQEKIRAKLVGEFGRSTVGELFEVVAKRILERGSVANREEFETVEPFVWTYCQYGGQVLGHADHRRLCGLLEDHRSGART